MADPSFADRMWRTDAVRAEIAGMPRPEEGEATVPVEVESLTGVEARHRIGELVRRASIGRERIVLSQRGRPVAVLAPMADLALIEELELRCDAAGLRVALAESREAEPLTLAVVLGDAAGEADRGATRLRLRTPAAAVLQALEAPRRGRLLQALHALNEDHRPAASRKLPGLEAARRLRVGQWRILYRRVAGTVEIATLIPAPHHR